MKSIMNEITIEEINENLDWYLGGQLYTPKQLKTALLHAEVRARGEAKKWEHAARIYKELAGQADIYWAEDVEEPNGSTSYDERWKRWCIWVHRNFMALITEVTSNRFDYPRWTDGIGKRVREYLKGK